MKTGSRGFTLIELLIVVAIIGILAAIAIPSFLEAQVRAKVAKVQAEYNTLRTALYAYHIDYGDWPSDVTDCTDPYPDHSTFWKLTELSTPISYLSTVPYQDPFSSTIVTVSCGIPASNHYQYYNWGTSNQVNYLPPGWPGVCIPYRSWFIVNVGPAQIWPGLPLFYGPGIPYDATNGTVSRGTLWVSEMGIFGDRG
jgi:type II secretion system protein G